MLVYGKYEWFVMHMLYVCVLCASCGSSQCCIPHDLQFVNAGSKRHNLQVVELTQRSQTAVQIVSNIPAPSNGGRFTLLQFTTVIETGFGHLKPPHRTVCVAIDLTAAFDTVSHDTLISKIAALSLPPATTRWLSCYLRGTHAATSFRSIKSRIVRIGGPQG